MYWTGVLYALDWCVVCTGLAIPVQYKPSTYTIPVQHTSPVHNTPLHVLNWERGWGIAPAPLLKRKRGGEKY